MPALALHKIPRKSLIGFADFSGQFIYKIRPLVAPSVNTTVVYGKLSLVADE